MSKPINYGREGKKIVFFDSDKRHAELKIRLKHDRLTQAEFFRCMVTGYLEKDSHILDFLDIYKEKDGRERKKYVIKNREMIEKGKELENKFALDDEEIENIFDILEGEHPEL